MSVMSLAVLTDPAAKDVVTTYKFELHDYKKLMEVPTVKVWEYANRAAELEQNPNPMALVVLAQVRFLANRKDQTSFTPQS